MTFQKRSFLVIAALAAISSASYAAILPTNGFLLAAPVAPIGVGAGVVDISTHTFIGLDHLNNTVFTGSETTTVYGGDTNNGLGGLTFVYTVSDDAASLDAINRVTLSGFSGFATDVGYIIDGNIVPLTVDRSLDGNVIGFGFPGNEVVQGATSAQLVIRTDAPFDIPNTMSIIDGGTGTASSFGPAPGGGGGTPEPASLGIMGVGALALMRRRRSGQV